MKLETDTWDAIVVGAGVAGSVAAALLAERGWRILLLEKSSWPRDKACGGCLNHACAELLRSAGLGDALRDTSELTQMELRAAGRVAEFPLPAGVIVERRILDARLVDEAMKRGVHFVSEALARLLPADEQPFRRIRIATKGGEQVARARLVLACDGLGSASGGFLSHEPWAPVQIQQEGRLGFSMTVGTDGFPLRRSTLTMCVNPGGYVGLVPLASSGQGQRIHVGAALLPGICNARGGPRKVMAEILNQCATASFDAKTIATAVLQSSEVIGTGVLTRRRLRVGEGRVLAIGDSCGYVEPFTGEGMAWAIRSAIEAVNLLPLRTSDLTEEIGRRWHLLFETEIRPRQLWCHGLRHILGNPQLTRLGMSAARLAPWGAQRIAHHISAG